MIGREKTDYRQTYHPVKKHTPGTVDQLILMHVYGP